MLGHFLNFARTKPKLELNLWDFDTETDDCFLGLTLAVKPSVSNLGNDAMSLGYRISVYSIYAKCDILCKPHVRIKHRAHLDNILFQD